MACHLRRIRRDQHVSLATMAERCQINRGTLSQVERGSVLPRDEWLDRLEDGYGVPVTDWYARAALLAIESDPAEEVA